MKISIAIMAHPSRTAQAEALYSELQQYPFAAPQIIYDQHNDEWTNGKKALQYGVGKGDWHVVIQDDAILTPDFYRNVENAIFALRQKTLISLYTGTARPMARRVSNAVDSCKDGEWLRLNQLLWGVGIVLPTDHIEPMLEFVENIELQYDNKIGEFYNLNGLPVYYCIPSLVDHNDDLGSLIDGHGKAVNDDPRVAHRLATGLVTWTNKERFI
jgi:hypothetical protein